MNISATELPYFIRKYYLLHELLISKYWRQNISVSNMALHTAVRNCQALRRPAHRARETVHLFTHETPYFITPALWPANSPDLNPVDYQICIWWKQQDRAYRNQICDVDQLKLRMIEEWEHSHHAGGHRWSDQAVASTSLSLRSTSSTRWTFWTQTLGVLKSCHLHGRTLDSQSLLCV